MHELVFIHGRSQEDRDSLALKAEWIEAWRQGLAKVGLELPIPESSIRLPYYGQTLFDMAIQLDPDYVADIIIRGTNNAKERGFITAVIQDVLEAKGISEDEVSKITNAEVMQRGMQNWPGVLAKLKALDSHLPIASAASIALLTQDVYCYLFNQVITRTIDKGVTVAIKPGAPAVVVGHSLGSVVAYKTLHTLAPEAGYEVPLFVTLGSPLAITTIRKEMGAAKRPACAKAWFNARDPQDVVALFPLSKPHFNLKPAIENKNDVSNDTSNHHGISGYLKDPVVARRLYDALLA